MSKYSVPAPPEPELGPFPASARFGASGRENPEAALGNAKKPLPPYDAAFLSRVVRSSLILGSVLALLCLSVTKDAFLTWSFALGELLSVALLVVKSLFVKRLAKVKVAHIRSTRYGLPLPEEPKKIRFPVWLLLPLKYFVLMIGIGTLIHFRLMNPAAFVTGVGLVQVVIVAKVLGRMMTHNRPGIREVYVEKRKSHAS
jgi:hypothetical protein